MSRYYATFIVLGSAFFTPMAVMMFQVGKLWSAIIFLALSAYCVASILYSLDCKTK